MTKAVGSGKQGPQGQPAPSSWVASTVVAVCLVHKLTARTIAGSSGPFCGVTGLDDVPAEVDVGLPG